jgi:hypothetical protein
MPALGFVDLRLVEVEPDLVEVPGAESEVDLLSGAPESDIFVVVWWGPL